MRGTRISLLFLTVSALVGVFADEDSHRYTYNEEVVLWINRVGPYRNPSETYHYYALPLCKPSGKHHKTKKSADIGEILQGNEMVESGMHMYFQVDVPKTLICSQELDSKSAKQLSMAVTQQYWYQFFLDELPVWGMLGAHKDAVSQIFTHKKIDISYNGDRIIQVNLTSEAPVEVLDGMKLEFTYAVKWHQTKVPFEKRFERYLDYSFFEHQIHWFSIFNSFMMVLFLCGLVSLILLRTLKNDFVRYREADSINLDAGELYDRFEDESGWKQVHGDVFRQPKKMVIFAALYGIGMQLLVCSVLLIVSCIALKLYIEPSEILHTALMLYCATHVVSGYTATQILLEFNYPRPVKWARAVGAAWGFLPAVAFAIISVLNSVAVMYNTNSVVPTKGVIYVFILWVFICLPLCLFGSLIARQRVSKSFSGFPVRVNALPRQIPPQKWFTKHKVLIPLTGWLPFASIFIETYFVLASFWNYKFYYVFGFSLLVLFILCSVVACVTVFSIYLILSNEDYRWHWVSFLGGGSVGVYVFLYSLYYFWAKTNMTGAVQTAYYLGYMFLFCLALSLLCGTVGSYASLMFVKRIYRNIHVD